MVRSKLAQCLSSYFGGPGKFSIVFSVIFQASMDKKPWENFHGKIFPGPGNLMVNIPLVITILDNIIFPCTMLINTAVYFPCDSTW